MENPVFKLEKVVRSRSEEMQDFEGPLDLILFLLGKNKMEIQDISISLICDQYLNWLEQRQKMDLEVASEFVTMASHLVYIKTRMLLSIEDEEAQSEMDALIQSLEERRRNENYVRVKTLAIKLGPMGEFGRNIITRNPEPVKRGKIYEYDQERADLVLASCCCFGAAAAAARSWRRFLRCWSFAVPACCGWLVLKRTAPSARRVNCRKI